MIKIFKNFRKTKCPCCNKDIDVAAKTCPSCHIENEEYRLAGFEKSLTMLTWPRQLALFLTGWIGLKLVSKLVAFILAMIAFSIYNGDEESIKSFLSSSTLNMSINAGLYILLALALVMIALPYLKNIFLQFKNWKGVLFGLAGSAALISFSIIYSLIISLLGYKNQNTNQESLESLISIYPFVSILIFGIIGPLCEEFTYRLGLFSILRRFSIWAAYIFSAIIFALIHFYFESSDIITELINIPVYLFAGFTFGFLYHKFGIQASITAHLINNLYSIIGQILTGLFMVAIL